MYDGCSGVVHNAIETNAYKCSFTLQLQTRRTINFPQHLVLFAKCCIYQPLVLVECQNKGFKFLEGGLPIESGLLVGISGRTNKPTQSEKHPLQLSSLFGMPAERFNASYIKNKIKREDVHHQQKRKKGQEKLKRRLALVEAERKEPGARKVRKRGRRCRRIVG